MYVCFYLFIYVYVYVLCIYVYVYICVLLTQYCTGDKIENNEMGRACGTYGGRERCAQGFGGET